MTIDVVAHADELRTNGIAFVQAVVVRAERPTSAKPGSRAIVHADGTMVGFVGGDCAQASVRAQALLALRSGEPVLLRIMPDDAADGTAPQPAHDGVITVHNPCLSGGTLEVFLEPTVPSPRVIVHGESPIALAFAELARHLGYTVETSAGHSSQRAAAVVVASHGDDEAEPLVAAVRAGVPYVGLVASRRRGPQVLEALELGEEEKARIHTPAGIDIVARTPKEVAVSIMAEIIALKASAEKEKASAEMPHGGTEMPDGGGPGLSGHADAPPATVLDPVCGMTVAAVDATLHADVDGVRYWFCGSGCRDAFVANPSAFAHR